MRVAITLPQFREDAETAIDVARRAEAAGIDGVFVFDHLWPIGQPGRPALHSYALLGALAAETTTIAVGSLVARIGLFPDAVVVNTLASLHRILGDRLIAGLGVGDNLSKAENEAYRVAFAPAAERLAALGRCCRQLRERGVTTWVGGRSDATRAVAVAAADAWNLWEAPADRLAAERDIAVTWGGQVRPGQDDLGAMLGDLAAAGATWAVLAPVECPWDEAVDRIAGVVTLAHGNDGEAARRRT